MYLIQVFGKGYLAGGQAVTPAKMHAPGLVARYTHDPRKALRVSLYTAEQMQRTHGGQFAAVPVEEALAAGPTSAGNPYAGETQILRIIPNVEDGTEVHVARIRLGYSVVLKDTDAGEFLSSQRIYKTEEAAMAAADAIAAGKDPAMRSGNPGARFYVAEDDWPLGNNVWWAVYDSVTREKMNLKGRGQRPVYGSERLAQRAADRLNEDWAAGKIEVIAEGGHAA
jgi:hypothetical protein